MSMNKQSPRMPLAVGVLAALAVFGLDLVTSSSLAIGLCYVAVLVLVQLISRSPIRLVWLALLCSVLALMGLPGAFPSQPVTSVANCAMSIALLWVVTLVSMRTARIANQVTADLRQEKTRLEDRFREKTAELEIAVAQHAASEDRFQLAVRGTTDGLWDWEVGTEQVWYSDRFKELLGCEHDDFLPTLDSFNSRLHPDDYDLVWDRVRSHLEDGEVYDVEYRLRTKETGYRWFRARGASARDQDGKPVRMAGSIQDIDARKRAEQGLRAYAERVRRSNQELEQFAYVASHDLQEPLRSVASFCGLLQANYADRLDEEGRDWLHRVGAAADRMRMLVRDLLAYSRIATRASPFEQVSCNHIVDTAIANLQAAIEESGASVTRDDLPAVDGDYSQLTQLFQNLIGNGLKFRSAEQPRVHIAVESKDDRWLFRVRDNGIGIDQELQEQVFEIFHRLHRSEDYEGTGIGLAVCRKVIRRHGGKIWVESTPNQGTTFFFTLLKADPRDDDHPRAESDTVDEGGGTSTAIRS